MKFLFLVVAVLAVSIVSDGLPLNFLLGGLTKPGTTNAAAILSSIIRNLDVKDITNDVQIGTSNFGAIFELIVDEELPETLRYVASLLTNLAALLELKTGQELPKTLRYTANVLTYFAGYIETGIIPNKDIVYKILQTSQNLINESVSKLLAIQSQVAMR